MLKRAVGVMPSLLLAGLLQTAAVSVGGFRYFSGFALYVIVIALSGVQFRE